MKIKEITDKSIWEEFLSLVQEKTFLSSWNWGEFNEIVGNKIWRWGIYRGEALVSVALSIKIAAKRGIFIFIPHGPNIKENENNNKEEILKLLLDELKNIAKKERAVFIRIAPI